VCTPNHPLAKRREVDARSLLAHDFIAREPGSGTREVTDDYFRACGVEPEKLRTADGAVESGSAEGRGRDRARLLDRVAREFREGAATGTLVAIPLRPRLKRTLSLVYPKERFRSKVVLTFVDFARNKLRELSA
jgi:DNA-binding transcriptional LysR family regulator